MEQKQGCGRLVATSMCISAININELPVPSRRGANTSRTSQIHAGGGSEMGGWRQTNGLNIVTANGYASKADQPLS